LFRLPVLVDPALKLVTDPTKEPILTPVRIARYVGKREGERQPGPSVFTLSPRVSVGVDRFQATDADMGINFRRYDTKRGRGVAELLPGRCHFPTCELPRCA